MLLSATPIAAIDVRWPLIASNGVDTHLLEPIAQLVYRGSDTTEVGITNDDAQSFVFDTSNLFSYNRFSGIDRQETGLRANIGGALSGQFRRWQLARPAVAGQSFHLAGVNALGVTDAAQAGTGTGLGEHGVLHRRQRPRRLVERPLGRRARSRSIPRRPRITRAGVGVSYTAPDGFSAGADYIYIAADPALGTLEDEHEIGGRVGVPVADYWTRRWRLTYDIDAKNWVKANTGVTYDDGYLTFGGGADFTPTSWGVGVTFKLKGPDGQVAF